MINKLNYIQLKGDFSKYNIQSIIDKQEIDNSSTKFKMLGQERVENALKLGLSMDKYGYNIYLSGAKGNNRTQIAMDFCNDASKNKPFPDDLCYVYNFKNPRNPKLLTMKNGLAENFKNDIDDLMNIMYTEIPELYSISAVETEKESVSKFYDEKKDEIIKVITEEAKDLNFGMKMSTSGIYFMPIVDGEIINEEQFETLDASKKEVIEKHSSEIQNKSLEVMKKIRAYEKNSNDKIQEIEFNVILSFVSNKMSGLFEKYKDNSKIIEYLKDVKEDILENVEDFSDTEEDDESLSNLIPWAVKKGKDDFKSKYKVNIFVGHEENSNIEEQLVINCVNPSYFELFGEIEFDNEFGNLTTDFMKIKSGLIHKANGGYLILKVQDLVSNVGFWDGIKNCLQKRKANFEHIKDFGIGLSATSINPEEVDIDFKVLLIGDDELYYLLKDFDEDFSKLFKVKAVFDYEMDLNEKNLTDYIYNIRMILKEFNFEIDESSTLAILEFCQRICESNLKLTTTSDKIKEVIDEAVKLQLENSSPLLEGEKVVLKNVFIEKAIELQKFRVDLYEDKVTQMYAQEIMMVKTDGEEVGQVNALAVLDLDDYSFANPMKITATTYVGKSGIVNIEKEAKLSGSSHDKGVNVITGYLGQTFAQDFPLSFSCRICFEQSYGMIDGDSASSTELYSILSSLSGLPIKQSFAVTGSVNQKGEIQAIGGVTYKVEGFHKLCKLRGLTGEHGVIIPRQNVSDLTLSSEVIKDIKDGKFNIYAIDSINDGIEILTGIKAGININRNFGKDSVNYKVYEKLKYFNDKSVETK